MSSLSDRMQQMKVFFAVPAYGSSVDVNFMKSMLNTQRLLDRLRIQNGLCVIQGDCYVARARNQIAAAFLKTDFTHLFFIDADMGWDEQKVVKLLSREKDFICGAYQLKNDNTPTVFAIDPFEKDGGWVTKDGLIKLRGAATGFMCLRRPVFERMITQYPDIAYEGAGGEIEHAFFHCSVRKLKNAKMPMWYGEDIDFSHKWIAMGGDIWCEPDIKFTHSGYKTWFCNLSEHLKAKEFTDEQLSKSTLQAG